MPDLIDQLCDLRADPVLIKAAHHGLIITLECAMEECRCPEGRGYFTKRGDPRNNPWAPSADRWPVPGREGGTYRVENVRLAHLSCNAAAGGRIGGRISGPITGARNLTYEDRVRGGRNGSSVAKARNLTHRDRVRGSRIGACARWNIRRGRSCVCGRH